LGVILNSFLTSSLNIKIWCDLRLLPFLPKYCANEIGPLTIIGFVTDVAIKITGKIFK